MKVLYKHLLMCLVASTGDGLSLINISSTKYNGRNVP